MIAKECTTETLDLKNLCLVDNDSIIYMSFAHSLATWASVCHSTAAAVVIKHIRLEICRVPRDSCSYKVVQMPVRLVAGVPSNTRRNSSSIDRFLYV